MYRGSSTLQQTIEWVQRSFGENRTLAGVDDARPPTRRPPPWLLDGIEAAIPIERTDSPRLEGDPGNAPLGPEPEQGSTVDDFFAFYLPFHFYRENWGTYIRAIGIVRLARIISASSLATDSSLLFALRLLLEHERLHYLTEIAAARLEVTIGNHCYRPYFDEPHAAKHEEAVANAHALTAGKRGISGLLSRAAESWMSLQGPGYCDFSDWLGRRLAHGKRKAAEFMVPPYPHREGIWPAPECPLEFLFEERRRSDPPTYLIIDVPVPRLRLARPFPKEHGLQVLVHTNDHKPPHIHVKVLQRRIETRYEWPALRPLPGDQRLSRAEERRLNTYAEAYEDAIDSKVKSVPWQ